MDIDFEERIYELLEELGFKKTNINGVQLYTYGESYYKITYIEGFKSYVIEYANSYEEATKSVFEDGDLYPVSLDDNLFGELRHDLIHYYINKSCT